MGEHGGGAGVASVGGSAEPDEYPLVEPRGTFATAPEPKGRIAIIGHSAGGFYSRIYMSDRSCTSAATRTLVFPPALD